MAVMQGGISTSYKSRQAGAWGRAKRGDTKVGELH